MRICTLSVVIVASISDSFAAIPAATLLQTALFSMHQIPIMQTIYGDFVTSSLLALSPELLYENGKSVFESISTSDQLASISNAILPAATAATDLISVQSSAEASSAVITNADTLPLRASYNSMPWSSMVASKVAGVGERFSNSLGNSLRLPSSTLNVAVSSVEKSAIDGIEEPIKETAETVVKYVSSIDWAKVGERFVAPAQEKISKTDTSAIPQIANKFAAVGDRFVRYLPKIESDPILQTFDGLGSELQKSSDERLKDFSDGITSEGSKVVDSISKVDWNKVGERFIAPAQEKISAFAPVAGQLLGVGERLSNAVQELPSVFPSVDDLKNAVSSTVESAAVSVNAVPSITVDSTVGIINSLPIKENIDSAISIVSDLSSTVSDVSSSVGSGLADLTDAANNLKFSEISGSVSDTVNGLQSGLLDTAKSATSMVSDVAGQVVAEAPEKVSSTVQSFVPALAAAGKRIIVSLEKIPEDPSLNSYVSGVSGKFSAVGDRFVRSFSGVDPKAIADAAINTGERVVKGVTSKSESGLFLDISDLSDIPTPVNAIGEKISSIDWAKVGERFVAPAQEKIAKTDTSAFSKIAGKFGAVGDRFVRYLPKVESDPVLKTLDVLGSELSKSSDERLQDFTNSVTSEGGKVVESVSKVDWAKVGERFLAPAQKKLSENVPAINAVISNVVPLPK